MFSLAYWQYWDLTNFTTFVSSVAAIGAFAYSFYQGRLIRQHNRLSVKPFLTTWFSSNNGNRELSFHLHNKGLGPARIKGITFFLDGKPILIKDPMQHMLVHAFTEHKLTITHSSRLGPNSALSVNEVVSMFEVILHSENELSDDDLEKIQMRMDMAVDYTSMYGEKIQPYRTQDDKQHW